MRRLYEFIRVATSFVNISSEMLNCVWRTIEGARAVSEFARKNKERFCANAKCYEGRTASSIMLLNDVNQQHWKVVNLSIDDVLFPHSSQLRLGVFPVSKLRLSSAVEEDRCRESLGFLQKACKMFWLHVILLS